MCTEARFTPSSLFVARAYPAKHRPMTAAPSSPRPTVGVGAIVWRAGRVLLIRRGQPPRRGEWSLPGGKQEWGETLEEALRREVFEETALRLGPLALVDVVDLIARDDDGRVAHHYTLVDYTAEALSADARAGDDAAAVAWFALHELDGLGLWSKTRAVIGRAARRHPSARSIDAG